MIRLISTSSSHAERNADLLRVASPLFFDEAAARAAAEQCTYVPSRVRSTQGSSRSSTCASASRGRGKDLSVQRFHSALLALGSPPLGLMETVLERGLSRCRPQER